MGVMRCNRRGCENVMCYRYSHRHGYICYDCFNELVSLGADTDVREFMDSEAGVVSMPVDAYELFNKEFSAID